MNTITMLGAEYDLIIKKAQAEGRRQGLDFTLDVIEKHGSLEAYSLISAERALLESPNAPPAPQEERPCPHAHRCVHPCDADECFLETIEKPNGPNVPLTKEQCDAFEAEAEREEQK